MSRASEFKELTRMRVLSFLREPEALFWVFFFPVVLAGVLGFAFRSGEPVPSVIALVDGAGADAMADALAIDEQITLERYETHGEAFTQLRKSAVDGLVEAGEPPKFTFDPVRKESDLARLRVMRAIGLAEEGREDPALELEEVTEKGSRYVDFLFPGLIGMNIMGTGIWGVGFGIADIRRRKFLRRLLVTPMRKSSFLGSFISARLIFLVLELTILTVFGAWVLGVPFRGDVVTYLVMCLLGAIVFSGLGILVASRANTIEAASGLMNLVMVPMWLLSGIFFSYERFPEVLHPLIQALPLTAMNDSLRGVMIDGESIFAQGQELAVLVVWCVASFAVALKIFRWD